MELDQVEQQGIGAVFEWCMSETLRMWKRQHNNAASAEQVWVNDIKTIASETRLLHGGGLRLRVTVETQKPWNTETYWFSWQRAGDSRYVLVAKV